MRQFPRVLAVAGLSTIGAAHAALPEGATTAFTSVAADAALVLAAAYVGMLAIRGGWIVFGMVKRGLSKAAN